MSRTTASIFAFEPLDTFTLCLLLAARTLACPERLQLNLPCVPKAENGLLRLRAYLHAQQSHWEKGSCLIHFFFKKIDRKEQYSRKFQLLLSWLLRVTLPEDLELPGFTQGREIEREREREGERPIAGS